MGTRDQQGPGRWVMLGGVAAAAMLLVVLSVIASAGPSTSSTPPVPLTHVPVAVGAVVQPPDLTERLHIATGAPVDGLNVIATKAPPTSADSDSTAAPQPDGGGPEPAAEGSVFTEASVRSLLQSKTWRGVELGDFTKLANSLTDTVVEADSTASAVKRQIYITLAQQPNVKRICEIGFDRGASASLWLKANPKAEVLVFDRWKHAYAVRAENALREPTVGAKFGVERASERLAIVKGSPLEKVPKYAGARPDVKCDIISISAARTNDTAVRHLVHMHALANPDGNVLLIDDANCDAAGCTGDAVVEATRRGLVKSVYGVDDDSTVTATPSSRRGVTVLQYPFPKLTPGLRAVLSGSWRSTGLSKFTKLADSLIDGFAAEGDSASLVLERQIYIALARQPNVKRICEIGFNRGASASLWLKANPTAQVLMFDLWQYDYNAKAENSLRSPEIAQRFGLDRAGERLTIVKGSSLETVPKYAAANPDVKCDLLSVDGGHTYDIAIQDIVNMHALANPAGNVLVVDDTNCGTKYCVDSAVMEAMRRGIVRRLYGVSEKWGGKPAMAKRGVTVLQYQPRQ